MCFIHNDILIIGPCSHEEIGYLKGEFLDLIEKLPLWDKTKLHCFASELFNVASGRSLDENFVDRMSFTIAIGSNRTGSILDGGSGTFRLGRYQINVATNGQVRWQAYGSMNRVLCGHCSLQSGVLFIGPEDQEEEKGSREDFVRKLEKLPQWDRTKIWSHSLALRRCQAWPHKAPPAAVIEKDTWGQQGGGRDHIIYVKPDMERTQRLGGQFRSAWAARFKAAKISLSRLHLPLVFRSRKRSWHLSRRVNFRLIWLILLVMAGLLLGLILSLHSLKERFHRFHSSEKHHLA